MQVRGKREHDQLKAALLAEIPARPDTQQDNGEPTDLAEAVADVLVGQSGDLAKVVTAWLHTARMASFASSDRACS